MFSFQAIQIEMKIDSKEWKLRDISKSLEYVTENFKKNETLDPLEDIKLLYLKIWACNNSLASFTYYSHMYQSISPLFWFLFRNQNK